MAGASLNHVPSRGPGPCSGIVQLCDGHGFEVDGAADHENLAIAEQRRRATGASSDRAPVAVHNPVAGSYSSAVANGPPLPSLLLPPPATSTLPSGRNVAV